MSDVKRAKGNTKEGEGAAQPAPRVTARSRRLTQELAETKNYLDNILQSSTQYSIIGCDLNYRVLSWNEGARPNTPGA